jgi:hypothetical protein
MRVRLEDPSPRLINPIMQTNKMRTTITCNSIDKPLNFLDKTKTYNHFHYRYSSSNNNQSMLTLRPSRYRRRDAAKYTLTYS